jgi:hypothetical protein
MVPCTVGLACFAIIEAQVFPLPSNYAGSFARAGVDGEMHDRPLFSKPGPFNADTVAVWLEARDGKTLTEIQIEAVEWLIAQETKIGFPTDADREKYLYPLERQVAELKEKAESAGGRRLAAGEAKRRIEGWYAERGDSMPCEERDAPASEWTTSEIWDRLGVQVFTVGMQGYLVGANRVVALGGSFGGMGLQSVCVSDLDVNRKPELLFTHSWGSSVYRSRVETWSASWPAGCS